jgi:hypothetical protein
VRRVTDSWRKRLSKKEQGNTKQRRKWQRTKKSKVTKNKQNTGGSISNATSLFSHFLEEMTHIIQITDEGQLQFLTIEFALLAGR